jgi:hypothetical protein
MRRTIVNATGDLICAGEYLENDGWKFSTGLDGKEYICAQPDEIEEECFLSDEDFR